MARRKTPARRHCPRDGTKLVVNKEGVRKCPQSACSYTFHRRPRAAAARKKAKHERFIALVGPISEGKPKNFCSCGEPMRLTETGTRDEKGRMNYGLFCAACEAFVTS